MRVAFACAPSAGRRYGRVRCSTEGRWKPAMVTRRQGVRLCAHEDEETFDAAAARAADIKDVIDGLLRFRQRIVDDTTALAKKIKAPKKNVQATLAKHPDILKIDQSVMELERELEEIGFRHGGGY